MLYDDEPQEQNRWQKLYALRKALGVCPRCQKPITGSNVVCPECRQKASERYHWLRSQKMCVACGWQPAELGRVFCTSCRLYRNQSRAGDTAQTGETREHFHEVKSVQVKAQYRSNGCFAKKP